MSIRDHAIIVSLTVTKPQMSKTDNTATRAAEQATNAHKAGHYRKDLYPKHLVQPIRTIESSARAFVENNTYPWARGEHLLPAKRFMQFAEAIGQYELQFDQAVTAFLQNWVNVLDQAKLSQGDLFNADDYPDLSDLRRQFRFKANYRQVADNNDIRVKLQDEEIDLLRKQMEDNAKEQMEDLMREPLVRLREAVQHIANVTGKSDRVVNNARTGHAEIKPPIFRDTVFDGLTREIELLSDFSAALGSDYDIAKEAEAVITTPEAIRNDPALRKETNNKTADLLARIDAMLEE